MPFSKGKSGNPLGRPKDKAFADAVRLAVNREAPDGRKKLMLLAEKLIDFAMAGEGWAMSQIADRLDGKPAAQIEHTGADGGAIEVVELTNTEAARRMAFILAKARQEQEPSLH